MNINGGANLELGSASTSTVTGGVTVGSNGRLDLDNASLTAIVTINGELHGVGTITGNLVNNGLVDVGFSPGIIYVNGNFVQGPLGNLRLEIGGPLPFVAGSNYDQLVVSGVATFGGTLTLVQAPGFESFAPPTLVLIRYQSHIGDFANTVAVGGPLFMPHITFGPNGAVEGVVTPPGDSSENKGTVTNAVVSLSDQQDSLLTCGDDEKKAPETLAPDQHGVGCKGI